MFSLGWLGIVPLAFLLSVLVPLAKNIRTARATGIPYIVVPYNVYNRITSIILGRTLVRLANKLLPEPSVTSWRRLVTPIWAWKFRHAPFAALGSDTFLTVAPDGIIMNTADAAAIAQITARGNDFPKATYLYRHVDIYGTNVVSSGGATWRRHRAVTAPAFTERNNKLVWTETLNVTRALVRTWMGPDGEDGGGRGPTISHIAGDMMRLSLEVIGRAGLGQKMEWPKTTDKEKEKFDGLPSGHSMSFTASLQFLLVHIFYVIAVPRWFLRHSPFKVLKKCYEAYTEWGIYMAEILAAKKEAIQFSVTSKNNSPTIDLISQLLRARTEVETEAEKSGDAKLSRSLTDSEVLGNLFMFIIAGHETSANSIHFCLLFLALHPAAQRKVQAELSTIFQSRLHRPDTWDYETDFPHLMNSYLAAVLYEELRLVSPTTSIPKIVAPGGSQRLRIGISTDGAGGRDVTVPPGCMVRLCIPCVHRNPRFWPHDVPAGEADFAPPDPLRTNDLEEFRPERWMTKNDPSVEIDGETKTQTPRGFYTPPRGAYIPFSDGQRACLGRRFALVEVLAALAAILASHSVELSVESLACDEELDEMCAQEKRDVWCRARERAREVLREKMVAIITLQLEGSVPVRIVRRGQEIFGAGVVGEEVDGN